MYEKVTPQKLVELLTETPFVSLKRHHLSGGFFKSV